jgi:hypothetical protein
MDFYKSWSFPQYQKIFNKFECHIVRTTKTKLKFLPIVALWRTNDFVSPAPNGDTKVPSSADYWNQMVQAYLAIANGSSKNHHKMTIALHDSSMAQEVGPHITDDYTSHCMVPRRYGGFMKNSQKCIIVYLLYKDTE